MIDPPDPDPVPPPVNPDPVPPPVEPLDPPPAALDTGPELPSRDIAARALWTLGEAAVAALVAWAVGLGPEDNPEWFAVVTSVGAGLLSAIKSFIGTKVGDPRTVTFQ